MPKETPPAPPTPALQLLGGILFHTPVRAYIPATRSGDPAFTPWYVSHPDAARLSDQTLDGLVTRFRVEFAEEDVDETETGAEEEIAAAFAAFLIEQGYTLHSCAPGPVYVAYLQSERYGDGHA